MNVFSGFDGMSGGLVALKRLGVKVDNYYASEIDKYAMKIAKKNHPEIIHLGSIEKYQEWDFPKIDLVIGGSPCQGFSFAGKQLNFNDPRSGLFFKFVEILWMIQKVNPGVKFLLENVKMKKEYENAISELMEVDPIMINSALVSAQNRKRLYWCNWEVEQPEDKGILLKDIIDDGFVDRNKSLCIAANYSKSPQLYEYTEQSRKQIVFNKPVRVANVGKDGQGNRIYSTDGKACCLSSQSGGKAGAACNLIEQKKETLNDFSFRKLTPVECERLQTLPDNYTEGVSNTQRYKMIGNGWTIDVISHILKSMYDKK